MKRCSRRPQMGQHQQELPREQGCGEVTFCKDLAKESKPMKDAKYIGAPGFMDSTTRYCGSGDEWRAI